MAGKNVIRKTLIGAGTWTVPAGVKSVRVTAMHDPWQSAGAIFLKPDGTVSAWGLNTSGQLGVGSISNVSSPITIAVSNTFKRLIPDQTGQVMYGKYLQYNFIVPAMGLGTSGQIGNSQILTQSVPSGTSGTTFEWLDVAVGSNCAYAIANTAGALVSQWGDNTGGQAASNTVLAHSAPTSMFLITVPSATAGAHKAVRGVGAAAFSLRGDGTLNCVGDNTNGLLGDGTVVSKSTWVSVTGPNTFGAFAIQGGGLVPVMVMQKTDGTAWAWGNNAVGQLGDGSPISRSSPVAVAGGNVFQWIVASTDFCVGKIANGSLVSWGNNASGQLGDGTTTNRSSPVAVAGGITDFTEVAVSSNAVVARRSDGSAWCWGNNTNGQLGDGTVANRSSPVAVVGGNVFSRVSRHPVSGFCGLKADGSLYMWGDNTTGNLGDNTATHRSSPVAVVGGYTFGVAPENLGHSIVRVTPGQSLTYGTHRGFFGPAQLPYATNAILLEYHA